MSKPIVLLGDLGTDHQGFPPTPVIAGSPTVLVDGKPVARVGDPLAPHSKPKHPPHPRAIAAGSSTVMIDGMPAAVTGSAVSCGGVTIGSGSVVIGDTHTPAAFSSVSPMAKTPQAGKGQSEGLVGAGNGSSANSSVLRSGNFTDQAGPGISGSGLVASSAEDSKKTEKTLYLGVFFDGTGNHKANDENLANRDVTNVAKLYDLYRDGGPGSNYRRIYVNGPGTIDGKHSENGFEAEEDLFGLGLGVGPEGGHDRIETALRDFRLILESGDYDAVVFDVFGFSRGAALARHFVNLINERPESVLLPRVNGFSWSGPALSLEPVSAFPLGLRTEVNFVGLFDTVGSFYWPGNDVELDFNLDLSPASAKTVVHLSAYHEIRKNFPLTSILGANGAGPSHFTEIAVPGVHSDVGGGYENPDKDFDNIEKIILGIHAGLADGGHTQRTAIPQLEAQYVRPGRTVIAVPQPNGDIHVQERRRTRKELAIYHLHQMHKLAVAARAPFDQLNRTSPAHALPDSLRTALRSWQSSGGSLESSRQHLSEFIHTSHCIFQFGMGQEASGKRSVFYNKPANAEVPMTAGVTNAQ
jgi:uncharacterized Zn-binding protein involved in type VI secretion